MCHLHQTLLSWLHYHQCPSNPWTFQEITTICGSQDDWVCRRWLWVWYDHIQHILHRMGPSSTSGNQQASLKTCSLKTKQSIWMPAMDIIMLMDWVPVTLEVCWPVLNWTVTSGANQAYLTDAIEYPSTMTKWAGAGALRQWIKTILTQNTVLPEMATANHCCWYALINSTADPCQWPSWVV